MSAMRRGVWTDLETAVMTAMLMKRTSCVKASAAERLRMAARRCASDLKQARVLEEKAANVEVVMGSKR